MRKVILACFTVALLFASSLQKAMAQACDVTNITIKLNSSTNSGGNCQLNIDLSWDQRNNGGNKFTTVHIWTEANYPNPQLTYTHPPNATDLANALGTLLVVNPTLATPTLGGPYQNAPATPILSATGITKTYVSGTGINTINRFTIKGIALTVPGACNTITKLIADVWSSNSNSNNGTQCVSPKNPFIVNDPLVNGNIICSPRSYTVSITSQSLAQTAIYTVYADESVFGVLDASDPVIFTSALINIPALGTFLSLPGLLGPNYNDVDVWVRVQVTGQPFSVTQLLTNNCPFLPVELTSFDATRLTASSVKLRWQTASENNNKGFEVQKKNGSGDFETITFISSSARGGNSNEKRNYEYTDNNSADNNTLYRLAQVDLDGRKTLSRIVIVKGNTSAGLAVLIYPNPSSDGNVNLSFNDASAKDLQLTDNSGRQLQSVRNLSTNQYTLHIPQAGLYFLNIRHQTTGETITRKIMVK